ncbi:hypothetical protein DKX38_017019 [Salix brachista]|uniref:Uncharacterized protein n=1 Tax=Salix brachista TaxID=2182728 RepID=A0A5N5KU21_9ROSI|nr:hypothetical protein DKX38_017019 [Salix brachista]
MSCTALLTWKETASAVHNLLSTGPPGRRLYEALVPFTCKSAFHMQVKMSRCISTRGGHSHHMHRFSAGYSFSSRTAGDCCRILVYRAKLNDMEYPLLFMKKKRPTLGQSLEAKKMSLQKQWKIMRMRVVQGMKEQASKCDSSSIKSLRDSACSSSSSSKQTRRFSGSVDSSAYKTAKNDKYKQAEESLRTVMFLSFWGPN